MRELILVMSGVPILFFVDLLLVSCVTLPLFYLIKSLAWRRLLLTLVGGYLVFLSAPHLMLFWTPYWIFVWFGNRVLGKVSTERAERLFFWLALFVILAPMLYWKAFDEYFLNWLNEPLRAIYGAVFPAPADNEALLDLVVPLGLSFSTFRAIDFLVCRHLNLISTQSLANVLFLGFFPPILLIGPIAQSSELLQKSDRRPVVPESSVSENLAYGALRIATGLVKIYALSLPLIGSSAVVEDFAFHPPGEVWLHVFFNAWYFYLNFAGFSDLAIGSARLYGYRLKENFSYPYFRRNLQQFWANWHMSLTSFAQRNVFVPLGGFRRNRQYLATFATMMVIALWHNLSWAIVVFGLLHSAVLIGLRYAESRRTPEARGPAIPRPLATVITFTFVASTVPLVSVAEINVWEYFRHVLFWGLLE